MNLSASVSPTSRYECVVIDDDPDMCRLISHVLSGIGVSSLGLHSAGALEDALSSAHPAVVFLDIALGRWDAIDGIRILEQTRFNGAVQLISGKDPALVVAVKEIGERHGLKMLEPLQKPFRSEHLRRIFEGATINVQTKSVPSEEPAESLMGRTCEPPPQVDLATALASRWIDVAYQPKVDLVRNRVVGAEGLARLNHPVHGRLSPASFLPGASDKALRSLTEFVIQRAFLDWEVLAKAGRNLRLAVNAPIRALLDPGLTAVVRERPSSEDWPGLIIEITESEAAQELAALAEAAIQLRIYNISLAIDDFGSGYSSFARLRQLPFSELKLDRSYVQNCATDPLNAGICRSIVDLARASGAVSVAEGIETAHDWTALARMRCDVGQGYYFGRPMSVGKLIESVDADVE
jgi:EAL domain-containing protein (putative c-di-GMP-specific phosphodiesterase class I)/FixJ family two-component response regulator